MMNILIVANEKKLNKDLGNYLKNDGCHVFFAKNTSLALDDLKKTPIDIVIADIMAPKMTGLTILSVVSENYPDIPIILITSTSSLDEAKAAMQEDAFDYLVKPIFKDDLLKSVHMANRHRGIASMHDRTLAMISGTENDFDQRAKTLYEAISGTFSTIGQILELKDPLSAGHERKVAHLALSIAKKMKLSQHQQDCVYFASFLHDIGKLVIPTEILSKPGKLTPGEYTIVKDHVVKGHELIKDIKVPWPVQDVVYQHHERLDGSGYPQALHGDDIMLEAKILAVADVIESMTSYRPYRPRFDVRVALNEISENRGRLYDETVCDATYSLFRDDNYQIEAELEPDNLVIYK